MYTNNQQLVEDAWYSGVPDVMDVPIDEAVKRRGVDHQISNRRINSAGFGCKCAALAQEPRYRPDAQNVKRGHGEKETGPPQKSASCGAMPDFFVRVLGHGQEDSAFSGKERTQ